MGKGSDLYFQQQRARQLREIEKHQAAQSGEPLRKLSWTERHVLGVKDGQPATPAASVAPRGEVPQERPDVPDAETPSDSPPLWVQGYMINASWDGRTLTVVASNKLSQAALRGEGKAKGPLSLRAEQIVSVNLKAATALVNGRLTVQAWDGKTYLLHFRRKSNADFERLYQLLLKRA